MNQQFGQWRTKRERDPSESRIHKRMITQEKINERLNEKENQRFNLSNGRDHHLIDKIDKIDKTGKIDKNDKTDVENQLIDQHMKSTFNQFDNQIDDQFNKLTNLNEIDNMKFDLINKLKTIKNEFDLSIDTKQLNQSSQSNSPLNSTSNSQSNSPTNFLNQYSIEQIDHLNQASNQTLKQKLLDLNNSKFVIEEGEENEELVNSNDFDASDFDYNGEDLSENDENYCANDYPDEQTDDELDFYRPYEDDYERQMLERFEKVKCKDDDDDYYSDY